MAEIIQEVKKVGGSLMVRIPKDDVKRLNIEEGDTIYFEPRKEPTELFGAFPELAGWKKPAPEEVSKYA